MYLWKYWRETRIAFCASLLGVALLLLAVLSEHGIVTSGGGPPIQQLPQIMVVLLIIQSVPLGFLGWILGSFGVGRDLGDGAGSFVFTRPASRASFVWRDWGFGMAELLTITVLLNLVIALQIYKLFAAGGSGLEGGAVLGPAVSPVLSVSLTCVVSFLLAALIFSLTYFSTILLKSSKGVMLGAGGLLGYVVLKAVIEHYRPTVSLPGLLPDLPLLAQTVSGIPGSLWLSLALRSVIVLAFPVAAQFALEKADL